jgi:hypothetical protein
VIVETLVKDGVRSPAESPKATAQAPDRPEEIEELLRIKRSRQIGTDRMPCPCCGVPVGFTVNRCPFCESDIAAGTALARETTRRLRELSGELDAEHAARSSDKPSRRGFFQRLKYLFEGDPEPDTTAAFKVDPYAKRLLGNLAPGDSFKILAEDGPWLQIKTPASEIGWVYSTVRKHP